MRLVLTESDGGIDSFTKDIGVTEYMYPEYDGLEMPEYGKGYEYSAMDDRLVSMVSALEGEPDHMVVTLHLWDEEMDEYEYAYMTDENAYSRDEAGYKRAVRDFRGICKALDSGEGPERVAKRFHMDKVV